MNKNKTASRPNRRKKPYFGHCRGIGIRYTPEEDAMIETACEISFRWMTEKYGKGMKPRRLGVGDR